MRQRVSGGTLTSFPLGQSAAKPSAAAPPTGINVLTADDAASVALPTLRAPTPAIPPASALNENPRVPLRIPSESSLALASPGFSRAARTAEMGSVSPLGRVMLNPF